MLIADFVGVLAALAIERCKAIGNSNMAVDLHKNKIHIHEKKQLICPSPCNGNVVQAALWLCGRSQHPLIKVYFALMSRPPSNIQLPTVIVKLEKCSLLCLLAYRVISNTFSIRKSGKTCIT